MTTATHADMHRDHHLWEMESALWRDDLRNWQSETMQMLDDLKQIEDAIRCHERGFEVHGAAIRLVAEDRVKHEHSLAEYERGECGVDLVAMAQKHESESRTHTRQRQAHEALKKHHHSILAKWSLLLDSFKSAALQCCGDSKDK